MPALYQELSVAAQTAYAEVLEQAQASELDSLSGLTGSFQHRLIKGHEYVYFGYRDPIGGRQRRVYVGPADDRVKALIVRFQQDKAPRRLAPNAQAAITLGCAGTASKHLRVIRQLGAYGFFKAGGVLVGTHAFVAMANMLGVRWISGHRTLDVDFAHAGRNVSLALPSDVELSVHDALTSLEMGLLPVRELSGKEGAQYRNPADPELRLDFLTSATRRREPAVIKHLGIALEPLKFMEFSLEGTTQAAVLGRSGACIINLPEPARYAVHKLIVFGERDAATRTKAAKDIDQSAALAQWYLLNGQARAFNRAWNDAIGRGRGWKSRVTQGRETLLARYPELDDQRLWRSA